MNQPPSTLNKSDYLRGHQCSKALWLAAFEPERLEPPDEASRARMGAGWEVGRVAHLGFPGGVLVEGTFRAHDRLPEAPAIFEATFETSDGLRARVDILARGQHGWRLIEVKSSTGVKDEHLPDVAFQYHVLRSCGVDVELAEILHVRSGYVRQASLDPVGLFQSTPVTEEVEARLPSIPALAGELGQTLRRGEAPVVPIGPHCMDPRPCDARDHCWAGVPHGSVLEISNLPWAKKFALYNRGIVGMEAVPADLELPKRSRRHVDAVRGGRPILDRAGLRGFLDSLTFPVFLLDFETVGPVIPVWDGTRPYQKIPFQYSLHVLRQIELVPEPSGFLAEPGPDPRPALLESLLEATSGEGSILAYHMPFELGVMKELARDFPGSAREIESRLPRMDDLIKPFRAWHFWLPAMGGSFSIKSVAPALAPELAYDDLDLRDGLAASLAFERLLAGVDPQQASSLAAALLAYCERDTLAMVRVLQAIGRAVQS